MGDSKTSCYEYTCKDIVEKGAFVLNVLCIDQSISQEPFPQEIESRFEKGLHMILISLSWHCLSSVLHMLISLSIREN